MIDGHLLFTIPSLSTNPFDNANTAIAMGATVTITRIGINIAGVIVVIIVIVITSSLSVSALKAAPTDLIARVIIIDLRANIRIIVALKSDPFGAVHVSRTAIAATASKGNSVTMSTHDFSGRNMPIAITTIIKLIIPLSVVEISDKMMAEGTRHARTENRTVRPPKLPPDHPGCLTGGVNLSKIRTRRVRAGMITLKELLIALETGQAPNSNVLSATNTLDLIPASPGLTFTNDGMGDVELVTFAALDPNLVTITIVNITRMAVNITTIVVITTPESRLIGPATLSNQLRSRASHGTVLVNTSVIAVSVYIPEQIFTNVATSAACLPDLSRVMVSAVIALAVSNPAVASSTSPIIPAMHVTTVITSSHGAVDDSPDIKIIHQGIISCNAQAPHSSAPASLATTCTSRAIDRDVAAINVTIIAWQRMGERVRARTRSRNIMIGYGITIVRDSMRDRTVR